MPDLQNFIQTVLDTTAQHPNWAACIILLLAFGESLAFLSLLLPATVILFGLGGLIGESGLAFWPLWAAAALGAYLGDWVSYAIGRRYQYRALTVWPLSRHPDMAERGHAFFGKWGAWGIFIGRFFGPLRAVVPLVAGICAMPLRPFQIANAASAMVWAFGMLAPGALGLPSLREWAGF
ncbi:DedA family protein [Pseudomonadota bacterium AL_CKDN230030165-1A_HGKHYDSX7]